ncbi:MAG: hypothetical protein KDB01_09645, partial [Planctomycetaceae bacterium]|nr:hypothetical protein [Planctomycetaceae bacterium]
MPYESQIVEPPYSEWSIELSHVSHAAIRDLREQARKRLVDAAEQYVIRLSQAATTAGLLSVDVPLLTGDPMSKPVIMTGHQPVVFHSGLAFKYQITEAFAIRNKLIAVAVVIDTDEGDAGTFQYPAAGASPQNSAIHSSGIHRQYVTRTASLAQRQGIFFASHLKSGDEIRAEFSFVQHQLLECGLPKAAKNAESIGRQYESLAQITADGFSTAEANLITRWNAGIGGRMLELPLSAICSFPEYIRFIAAILEKPFQFAVCYNQTLTAFRAEHRIRNEANPFPNLTIEEDWCELPLWGVNLAMGTRHVLQVRRSSDGMSLECNGGQLLFLEKGNVAEALTSLLFAGQLLVPRGALITATLRLLFSDLFVHGTGGGKYDPCTDALIQNWWNIEPTPFSVASASRYLLADERTRLMELRQIESQLREMQYNPQRFLGTRIFSSSLEERLTDLLRQKDNAVQQMQLTRETG